MKIAIYSPYLDTAGGGEKYILTIAETLKQFGNIDVLLDSHLSELEGESLKTQNEKRLGLDLRNVNFIKAPIGIGSSFFKRSLFLLNYDWLFYETDGSWFFSTSKNNIIHFQVPFTNLPKLSFWQRLKLSRWKLAIYNSKFTSEIIENQLPIKGRVIYPPVDTGNIKPLKKQSNILSVGRFSSHTRSKKHEVMIETFKKLSQNKLVKNWSLHLAGGVMAGDQDYVDELRSLSEGYKIFFYPDISLSDLRVLYGICSIYWHAAGYEETQPEKFEHFGISTVEAMIGGCVPVVIKKGGQIEIVSDGENGFLWQSLDEFVEKTLNLINNQSLMKNLSDQAIQDSQKFSVQNFRNKIIEVIKQNHD